MHVQLYELAGTVYYGKGVNFLSSYRVDTEGTTELHLHGNFIYLISGKDHVENFNWLFALPSDLFIRFLKSVIGIDII